MRVVHDVRTLAGQRVFGLCLGTRTWSVGGFFAALTKRRLKRGVFKGVVDLQTTINRFLAEHNRTHAPSSGPLTRTRSSPPAGEGTKC